VACLFSEAITLSDRPEGPAYRDRTGSGAFKVASLSGDLSYLFLGDADSVVDRFCLDVAGIVHRDAVGALLQRAADLSADSG
jgi:hypothetical protein